MKKPAKKRKGDAAQVAYSVVQDVITMSNRPFTPPPPPAQKPPAKKQ
jgi:hypothetical protein